MNTTIKILRWFGVFTLSLLTIGALTESVLSTIAFVSLTFITIPNNSYNQTIKDKITNRGFIALVIGLGLTGLFATGPTEEENLSEPIAITPVREQAEQASTTISDIVEVEIVEKQEVPNQVVKKDVEKPLQKTNSAPTIKPVEIETKPPTVQSVQLHRVISVVDGDTVKVSIDGKTESIRIIGIDTPEIGSRLECFGNEAKQNAEKLLNGKHVEVIMDPTQGDRDKYGRLLAYLQVSGQFDFGEQMVKQGYAHEYTYNLPYKNQSTYKNAQSVAERIGRGLWSPNTCPAETEKKDKETETTSTNASTNTTGGSYATTGECKIKGNISSENIYHTPGQRDYERTKIDESKGERWFCTEQEAKDAGWRKALR